MTDKCDHPARTVEHAPRLDRSVDFLFAMFQGGGNILLIVPVAGRQADAAGLRVRRRTRASPVSNDPVPCPEPAERAVRLAVLMRHRVRELCDIWRKHDHDLDFGVGIAKGHATLGRIGFEGRFDYAAIGTVTNLAARLCSEAGPGQILISRRVHSEVENLIESESIGDLTLKGFARPVPAFNILNLKSDSLGPNSNPGGRG